ncbi:MAG: hypothetical protein Fur005_33940 [Roseiflexaceae bacterium]
MLQLTYAQLPPDEIDAQFEAIIGAGMKMNTIIESLLMLSSLRLQQKVQHSTLNMGSIVEEVLYHLQPQIQQAQAKIALPQQWSVSYGYAPWVEEVWINYLTNALKYGGTPPQIEIGADQPIDGIARFWVQDNGAGITPEQQALLFTPFTRLYNAKVQGHGLGLSIVQRIVAKLGGEVGVESYPGCGSRFFFTLPIDCPTAQPNEPIAIPVQVSQS